MTRVQLAGCYQVASARRRIMKLTPTIKCSTASVIEANGVEIMHVWRERMLHPPGTHNFKTVQPETTRVLSEVSSLHWSRGQHFVISSPQLLCAERWDARQEFPLDLIFDKTGTYR
jgi:hypothetical protein